MDNIFFEVSHSAAFMMTPATEFTVAEDPSTNTSNPWASWGSDNKQPITMANFINTCGVLNAGIEAKARICIGKGIRPVLITNITKDGTEEYEFVNDPEINDWMEENNVFSNGIQGVRNKLGYGWSVNRFIMSADGQRIARWQTDDVVKFRLKKMNPSNGRIEHVYMRADWNTATKKEKEIKLLMEKREYWHLTELIKKGNPKEVAMIVRDTLNGKLYYPDPLWWSAKAWVELAAKVPDMKVAMMRNQMSIKYLISISEDYFKAQHKEWDTYTAEKRKEAWDALVKSINDNLSGNDKAYKSIATPFNVDPITGQSRPYIKIEAIDDKVKDGKLLPDSGAANKEILFALMMNPAINGADTAGGDYSGGAGSGSDIREAYLVQIMLMEAERQETTRILNIVKKINGWDKKYAGKNLQFRYPNLILTTLDTGGSTTPTV